MKWLKGIGIFLALVLILMGAAWGLALVYKKEILAQVSGALKTAFLADVQIGDADLTLVADFPNLTLRLEDVSIAAADSLNPRLPFFKTHRIDINIRTYKLLFKEVHFRSFRIEGGEVFVYRSADGSSNVDSFKRKRTDRAEQTETIVALSDGRIFFEDCHFVYSDSLRRKFFSFNLKEIRSNLSYTDSIADATFTGAVEFDELQFNPSRGSFMKNMNVHVDVKLRYYTTAGQLFIENAEVGLPKSKVRVKGQFDFGKARRANLVFQSDDLDYREGLSVVPESMAKTLGTMRVDQPIRFGLNLEALLGQEGQPAVDMSFELRDNVFRSDAITITHLSLNGTMTNHVDDRKPFDNANSMVELMDIKGRIDDLPFEAEAALEDLNELRFHLHSIHKLTLPQLNREMDTTQVRFLRGQFTSEFTYQGKVREYLNQSAGAYLGELKGQSTIRDGKVLIVARKLTLDKINAAIAFTEDSVRLNNFSFTAGKNKISITGLITNFVPFFVQPKEKGVVKLDIRSPSIDMADFLVKKSKKKVTANQKKIEKKKVSDMLDGVFRNLQFEISLKFDKVKHKSFNVSKLGGQIRLKGTTLEARNLKMNFGGGQLSLYAVMKNLDKDVNPVELSARMSGVRIRDVFKSFDNFDQKVITDKNLDGTVTMTSNFRTRINDDFVLNVPSLRGNVSMVIRNGRLIEVEAFRKMSNFLFKRRDFDDVKFAQIDGNFTVSGRKLDISRMEIQSTVLSLFLEGTYDLDNHANLTIQVPLSNLKRRDKNYVPKNVGVDAKVGPSVFLQAVTNEKGETEISYDLFRSKKKSKKVSSRQ